MARYQTGLPSALVVLALLSTLLSCGPTDVNTLRQNYTAELNSWFKEETPMSAEAIITVEGNGEDSGEAAPGEGAADGEDGPVDMPETMQISQKVTLDILVKHEGGGELPGITLDISQADSSGNEKQNWKLWVKTSDLGVGKQITQTLEGVTLDEGDGFHVEVRPFVPPEEQGEYQEFSSSPSA